MAINPYGITNFIQLRQENHYYVDKTRYIRLLDEAGDYYFIHRPRRMGKTLWLSTLECYHDIHRKNEFDELFSGLEISADPEAPAPNTFLVMKFNFSLLEPNIKPAKASFDSYLNTVFKDFTQKYKSYLEESFFRRTKDLNTSTDKLNYLFHYASRKALNLYILIDDYDHFMNTNPSASKYPKIADVTEYFRYFFTLLKSATGNTSAGDLRIFVTGVSPINIDNVTSGFNIGTNISQALEFNELMGFTEGETRKIPNASRKN